MTLDAHLNIIRAFDKAEVHVLIITYNDLVDVINKGKNLYDLLREKYFLVNRTFKIRPSQITAKIAKKAKE
jgi:hypothetical protein